MASRLDLNSKLIALLGSNNVYFEPPESIKLNYPCIVYERMNGDTKYANNMPYHFTQGYKLTYITHDVDSSMVETLAYAFPMISYSGHMDIDNLSQDTYNLYY